MEYFVIAPDGQQYGPASIDTLKQWVAENRITQTTMLRHGPTGQTGPAGSVPGLFAAPTAGTPSAVQAPTPGPAPATQVFAAGYEKPEPEPQATPYSHTAGLGYQNPYQQAPQGQWAQSAAQNRAASASDYSADRSELLGVIFRVCLALVLVVVFRYAGLISSLYACYYAFTNASGNRYGVWMVVLAVACLAVVGLTWLLRFNGLVSV